MSETLNIQEDEGTVEAIFETDASIYQILFNEEGVITSTMSSNMLSEGFLEVTQEVYYEATTAMMRHGAWFRDGKVVAMPAPPPPPIVLSAEVLFFDRMTDDEYDALDASVKAGETARVYRGWAAATSFTEGTDMWTLLVKHLDAIETTVGRKSQLLARP